MLEMNELKKPSTLLSVTSFLGVVGVSIYFYRQTHQLRKQLADTTDTLNQVSKKVAELSAQSTQVAKLIRAVEKLNSDIKALTGNMNSNIGDIDELRNDMESVFMTFESKEIEIVSPEKVRFKKQPPARQGQRQQPPVPQPSRPSQRQAPPTPEPVRSKPASRRQQPVEEEEEMNFNSDNDDISEPEVDEAINLIRSNRRN